ncbi:TPA: glycosyltransferase [Vibrio cholerae]
MKSKNKISLIAPFYNEEKGVVHFIERVNEVMEKISDRFDLEIVCINDGSRDGTLNELVHVKKIIVI